jgi:hypothetical protein
MKGVLIEFDEYNILKEAGLDENSSLQEMIRCTGKLYEEGDEDEKDKVRDLHSPYLEAVFHKHRRDGLDYSFNNLEPSDDPDVLALFKPDLLAKYADEGWEVNPALPYDAIKRFKSSG